MNRRGNFRYNPIVQSWQAAFSKDAAPEKVPIEQIDEKVPFYKKNGFKRILGGSVVLIGLIVRIKNVEIGNAIVYIGNGILTIGVAHAAVKSSPAVGGNAGILFKTINKLFTKGQ